MGGQAGRRAGRRAGRHAHGTQCSTTHAIKQLVTEIEKAYTMERELQRWVKQTKGLSECNMWDKKNDRHEHLGGWERELEDGVGDADATKKLVALMQVVANYLPVQPRRNGGAGKLSLRKYRWGGNSCGEELPTCRAGLPYA